MKYQDIKIYFGSFYRMRKETGIADSTSQRWKKLGYIPITAQLKLEKLTKGGLKASLEDIPKINYEDEPKKIFSKSDGYKKEN